MADIIETGKHIAIPLKHFHGAELLKIDRIADDICKDNEGNADILLELRHGHFRRFIVSGMSYMIRKLTGHTEEEMKE